MRLGMRLGMRKPKRLSGIGYPCKGVGSMKLIIAYIQPHKLNDVKQELYKEEVFKISVTNALGCGQQRGYHESYRGVDIEVNLLKKIRLEVAVNEDFVQQTIDAIVRGARTGDIGDGKIFVIGLEECIRIRSGETGKVAIG
jgi:nitrogen regulatory protein P-II 1